MFSYLYLNIFSYRYQNRYEVTVMSVDYNLIGARVQRIRKSRGITQEKLAEGLQVSVGYVSQIERGITKANLEMLSSICCLLECDICELLGGTIKEQTSYLDEEIYRKFQQLTTKQKQVAVRIIDAVKDEI